MDEYYYYVLNKLIVFHVQSKNISLASREISKSLKFYKYLN